MLPWKSYQRWRVLVWPEGLRDGPVPDGDACFGVGSDIDQFVTTMPWLYTGLQWLSWSIWVDEQYKREATDEFKLDQDITETVWNK